MTDSSFLSQFLFFPSLVEFWQSVSICVLSTSHSITLDILSFALCCNKEQASQSIFHWLTAGEKESFGLKMDESSVVISIARHRSNVEYREEWNCKRIECTSGFVFSKRNCDQLNWQLIECEMKREKEKINSA